MRLPGALLVVSSVLVLVAAGLPDPEVFASPDPIKRLQAIADRPWGWSAQAALFPVAFAGIGVAFGLLAARAPARSRPLAWAGTGLSVAALALWLPIAASRLELGGRVDVLAADPAQAATAFSEPMFWPYTIAALAAVELICISLVRAGTPRRAATVVGGLTLVGLAVAPIAGDWPPFATYLMTLALGTALLAARTAP